MKPSRKQQESGDLIVALFHGTDISKRKALEEFVHRQNKDSMDIFYKYISTELNPDLKKQGIKYCIYHENCSSYWLNKVSLILVAEERAIIPYSIRVFQKDNLIDFLTILIQDESHIVKNETILTLLHFSTQKSLDILNKYINPEYLSEHPSLVIELSLHFSDALVPYYQYLLSQGSIGSKMILLKALQKGVFHSLLVEPLLEITFFEKDKKILSLSKPILENFRMKYSKQCKTQSILFAKKMESAGYDDIARELFQYYKQFDSIEKMTQEKKVRSKRSKSTIIIKDSVINRTTINADDNGT